MELLFPQPKVIHVLPTVLYSNGVLSLIAKETVFMLINMKSIKEVIKEIEHIPKFPRSEEINLYYLIKLHIKKGGKAA